MFSFASAAGIDPAKNPEEIALSMTADPSTSININWTTIDTTLTNSVVLVWAKNDKESSTQTFTATAVMNTVSKSTIPGVTSKTFYSAKVTGLKANREYLYRCGTPGEMSAVHSFKTAPNNNGSYTFLYVSDSQVSGNHSKA